MDSVPGLTTISWMPYSVGGGGRTLEVCEASRRKVSTNEREERSEEERGSTKKKRKKVRSSF